MKIKRDTTYNQNAKPFIRENMNSWIPPTFQAMTLWPVFAGDSRYTKGYWVSHNHFENLDIQAKNDGFKAAAVENMKIINVNVVIEA